MSGFDVNNLVVLHLYNYIKPGEGKDPLQQVEKACQVVKLSTCMRTIYVLNKDALKSEGQQFALQALTAFIDRRDMYSASTKFECLEGVTAYQFLLYWILGGINPKKTFQDERILGEVRNTWAKLCASPSNRAKERVILYNSLFNDLFTDSGNLRKLIPMDESFDRDFLEPLLKTACERCAWARVNGFLACMINFDYKAFADGSHLEQFKEYLIILEKRLLPRSKAPLGEEALQSIEAEKQREGICKRLEEIERLFLLLDSLKSPSTRNRIVDIDHNENKLEHNHLISVKA